MNITDPEYLNFTARLEDRYFNNGHPQRGTPVDQLGYGRWEADYITLRAGGSDHETATVEVMRRIEAIEHPAPPPAPLPPGTSCTPLEGYLRLYGHSFGDDTGPRRVQFCSWFPAFRIYRDNPDEFKRQLDRVMGNWQGIRMYWWLLGYGWEQNGNSVDPRWPDIDTIIHGALTECAHRNLKVAMTSGDLYAIPEGEIPGMYRKIASVCAGVNETVVAMSSVINESWMTSPFGEDFPRYAEYSKQWQSRYPWGQHGLTCPSTMEDEAGLVASSIAPATVTLLQGTRLPGQNCFGRAFTVEYEGRRNKGIKPIVEEEPGGNGPDVYQPMNDHDDLLGLYTIKILTGQFLMSFNGSSLYNKTPLDTYWGFKEIPALWKQMEMPQDVGQWVCKPLHHTDSPCTGSGMARLDGVTNGSLYYGVVSGDRDWTIGPSRWDADATIYDSTGSIFSKVVRAGETIKQYSGTPKTKVIRLVRR